MENNSNLKFILTTRCALYIFLIAFIAASCSNKGDEQSSMRDFSQRKRAGKRLHDDVLRRPN